MLLSVMASHLVGFCGKKIAYEPHFIISAIATVVTVAEILKNNGLAVEKSKFVIAYMSVIHFFIFLSNHSTKIVCRDNDIHS
jgi:hypothetical protein